MQGLREDFRLYVAQGPSFEYSSIISSRQDIEWIISQLPEKPKTITLLFSTSIHGWKYTDGYDRCLGSRHILMLLKSTKGRTAGGYLPIQLEGERGWDHEKTFILSLESKMKLQFDDDDSESKLDVILKELGLCSPCLYFSVREHDKINTNYSCDCGHWSEEEKEEYFKVPLDELSSSILNENS